MSRDPPDLPSFPTRRTSDLREQLRVEVAPAERLLLDLEAGELPLELGDGRVLNRLDRLRLDLRVPDVQRSEEHTSELQSPYDIVCRLLLEKKKPTVSSRRTS